jgi:hypothetical protein
MGVVLLELLERNKFDTLWWGSTGRGEGADETSKECYFLNEACGWVRGGEDWVEDGSKVEDVDWGGVGGDEDAAVRGELCGCFRKSSTRVEI